MAHWAAETDRSVGRSVAITINSVVSWSCRSINSYHLEMANKMKKNVDRKEPTQALTCDEE